MIFCTRLRAGAEGGGRQSAVLLLAERARYARSTRAFEDRAGCLENELRNLEDITQWKIN
jgi:hypothetical protein